MADGDGLRTSSTPEPARASGLQGRRSDPLPPGPRLSGGSRGGVPGVVAVPAGCRGPRSLYLRRDGETFGFTLRHFILYPPDGLHETDGRHAAVGALHEPMETIFVKDVTEGGAAARAGLHTGDRLVSVNNESLAGKPYAEVVRMIKNSPNYLHLLVVPKEHDVLQKLFYEAAHNPESNQRLRAKQHDNWMSRRSWAQMDEVRRESVGSSYGFPDASSRDSLSMVSSYDSTSTLTGRGSDEDSVAMHRMRKSLERKEEFLRRSPARADEAPAGAACIVQRRTKQFEAGAALSVDEGGLPLPDRVSLHRSELSRFSATRAEPTVASRRLHFETSTPAMAPIAKPEEPLPSPPVPPPRSSGNRTIPVGGTHLHCPPPQSRDDETAVDEEDDVSIDSMPGDSRVRRRAVRQDSYITAVKARFADRRDVGQAVAAATATTPSAAQAMRPSRLNLDAASATPDSSSDSLSDEDKTVRRASYLRAFDRLPAETDSDSSPRSSSAYGSFKSTSPKSSPRPERPTSPQTAKESQILCKVKELDGKKSTNKSWKRVNALLAGGRLYLHAERLQQSPADVTEFNTAIEDGVDLRGCTISLAEEWTRRRHIIRIERPGLEVLLRTDGHQDLNEWVRLLQEACSGSLQQAEPQCHPAASSVLVQGSRLSPQPAARAARLSFRSRSPTGQSPVTKTRKQQQQMQQLQQQPTPQQQQQQPLQQHPENTSSSPSMKSTSWRGRVAKHLRPFIHSGTGPPTGGAGMAPEPGAAFGIPLEQCLPAIHNTEVIPRLVELCTEIVEGQGLEVVGIYRVPGNSAAVGALTDELDKGFELGEEQQDVRWNDMNVVSSLLKSFFRKLPDSLLTSTLYPRFIAASKIDEPRQRLEELRKVLRLLPQHNYATLRHLILHLAKVMEHNEVNKMDSRNLAIVFGPTLVRYAEESMVTMVNDMSHQCKIVESLLCHAAWFFAEDDSPGSELPEKVDSMEGYPTQAEDAAASQSLLLGNISKVESMTSKKDVMWSILSAARKKGRKPRGSHSSDSKESPVNESKEFPGTRLKEPVVSEEKPTNEPLPISPACEMEKRKCPVNAQDGHIQTYTGLNQVTNEMIRKFEQETKAMLQKTPSRLQQRDSFSFRRVSNPSDDQTDASTDDASTGSDLVTAITSIYDLKLKKMQALDLERADIPYADESPEAAAIPESVTSLLFRNPSLHKVPTPAKKEADGEEKAAKPAVKEEDEEKDEDSSLVLVKKEAAKDEVDEAGQPDNERSLKEGLARSESLRSGESRLKRTDSLTKTEKTESNLNKRRELSNRRAKDATNAAAKLKRKNGMPERSIKRRHTVGGTKDFDKVNWLDNRLAEEAEDKRVRTSSPDLSSVRRDKLQFDPLRPQSAPEPRTPIESHV